MPRTKVPKNAKRNRAVTEKEERIREFERQLDVFTNQLDSKNNELISEIEVKFRSLHNRLNGAILDMQMGELMKMDLKEINDYPNNLVKPNSSSCSAEATALSQHLSARAASGLDDGYITEESGSSTCNSALTTYTQRLGRTPGPLSSARARAQRRSRSASSNTGILQRSALASKSNMSSSASAQHVSRNKLRTPMAARPKAFSTDRAMSKQTTTSSPASAFMRWPKPGELVMSSTGSPVVAQVMPDRYANVNIPVKNGILSLRPKKLENIDTNLIENLDPETIGQIKTLHQSLDLIVNLANKMNKKN